jgi:hypothetical protein
MPKMRERVIYKTGTRIKVCVSHREQGTIMGCEIKPRRNKRGDLVYGVTTRSVFVPYCHQKFTDKTEAEEFRAAKEKEIALAEQKYKAAHAKGDHGPVWETIKPPAHCWQCGSKEIYMSEPRPTGTNFRIQEWQWCKSCWGHQNDFYATPCHPSATPQTEPSASVA